MVAMTTDQTFKRDVLDATLPVVVDFMAEWCGPCRQMAPILEEIAQELQGQVSFFKMDVDANPEIPNQINIRSIPTLIFYKNGVPVDIQAGAMPKQKLLDWIKRL